MTISIHAPTKGATLLLPPALLLQAFQSTLPRRERPFTSGNPFKLTNFNPRSHEGSDRNHSVNITPVSNFNPRSHEGSDTVSPGFTRMSVQFQSTLPRRERLRTFFHLFQVLFNFNPRSHEGSDDFPSCVAFGKTAISIHAPTKGAT